MIAVAQDVQGEERVRPLVEAAGIEFPVLIDRASAMSNVLSFRIVPSGAFVDVSGVIRYRHVEDFDIGDPRVRASAEDFLEGREVHPHDPEEKMSPDALELFAQGGEAYAAGDHEAAVVLWRAALVHDPDNFLIRSQIWAIEHPERFYPVVDRDWQAVQLLKEGYDKPLP